MRAPDTTTSMDRPVNLLRATTTCNTFYIFLSAAKAALLPFLTLFFRLIGLSAMETGIVMAAKTLTGFVWAPLWARCAVAYNKRRTVLVFSLLMMMLMYMSFVGVYYKVGSFQPCMPAVVDGHPDGNVLANNASDGGNNTQNSGPGAAVQDEDVPVQTEHGTETPANKTNVSSTTKTGLSSEGDEPKVTTTKPHSTAVATTHPVKEPETSKPPVSAATPATPPKLANTTVKPEVNQSGEVHGMNADAVTEGEEQSLVPAHPAPPPDTPQSADSQQNVSVTTEKPVLSDQELDEIENMLKEKTGYGFSEIKKAGLSAHTLYLLAKKYAPDVGLTEEEIQQIMDAVNARHSTRSASLDLSHHRAERSLNLTLFNTIKKKVGSLAAVLDEKKMLLFLIILLIIIFGEFFSSPVEKIADDAWFDFLERIDDMEKYGRQRYWGSLTYALVPIVVSVLVDYTPCRMMLNTHHFLMHFYVFGVFLIFTMFLAFYFPMPPPVKQKYSSKVAKGLRIICCDGRGFLFVVTLLVAGMVYASFNNFLFWRLQDLGGTEVVMGLCVSIAAFAETPMLIFSNKLVTKLGNGGVVSISLFILALRVLYYGFLWTPWAVLPAEVTNAFTHTAMWYAVLSYDEFNVGSSMDRSIRSILSSIYFGLGFSAGSFVSGVVYQTYGASVLFWGASVLSGAWCLLYSVIRLCLPKKERVKYIKLLRNEEESSEGEDDWLEMALKDQ